MEEPKQSRERRRKGNGTNPYGYQANYGYGAGNPEGYGGYGYGGYGYGENEVQKTFQDYFLILRERVWYVLAAFLVLFAATVIFTYSRTPLFESTATVQIFRRNPTVMQVQQVMDSEVRSAEDVNTQVNILKSTSIIQEVADQLKGDDLERFLAPYRKDMSGKHPPTLTRILELNREIIPERLSLIINIQYRHPDKEIAAKVANLFADGYIAYSAHVRVDESLKAVEELELRATEQRKKVDDIARALQAYREKNNLISLDQRKDISTDTLKELASRVTQASGALQEAETRWKQVLAARKNGVDLLTLSFIASDPNVADLQKQVAPLRIAVAQLSQHYRAKHPKMIEAVNSLDERP